MCAYIVVYNCR